MTRKKKGRRVGSEGPAQYSDKSQSRRDLESLMLKKLKKRKGKKAGSRHSDGEQATSKAKQAEKDPRLGSKKPIPLIVEEKPHPKSAQAKKVRKLDAEQELQQLENDAQLTVLLDRIENGEKLGAGLQAYVDEKLDRIEQLMAQLGLLDDEPEVSQDMRPNRPRSDDDLLDSFENFDQSTLNRE